VTAGSAAAAADSTAELDAMTPADAAARLAPLFEGAPRFLARLVADRPFGSWPGLFDRARAIAHAMPEAEQVELIDAHPRLGAAPATVSRASFHEQGYDRGAAPSRGDPARDAAAALRAEPARDPIRDPIRDRLAELNAAYEARFGFRYCVFVAGRPLAELIPELEAALGRPIGDLDLERARAIDAVIDIARARHAAGVGAGAAPR
jgi:2-oxo-4-hydroxy-4-carboxy--5-ureidoimidazoline (OHCU) decarboxylase